MKFTDMLILTVLKYVVRTMPLIILVKSFLQISCNFWKNGSQNSAYVSNAHLVWCFTHNLCGIEETWIFAISQVKVRYHLFFCCFYLFSFSNITSFTLNYGLSSFKFLCFLDKFNFHFKFLRTHIFPAIFKLIFLLMNIQTNLCLDITLF